MTWLLGKANPVVVMAITPPTNSRLHRLGVRTEFALWDMSWEPRESERLVNICTCNESSVPKFV